MPDTATRGFPHTRKILDLSTAHLPEHLGADLGGAEGVVAYDLDYGWLMWVPDAPADDAEDGVPPEVLAVQVYARRHGCDYVLFDCDAERDPNLPTWDW